MDRARDDEQAEQTIMDLIACGGGAGEDDGSQYLNESGEGMELERRDEGQTNNDDEENVGALTKSGEVYILSLWWLDALIDLYIYINESFFF